MRVDALRRAAVLVALVVGGLVLFGTSAAAIGSSAAGSDAPARVVVIGVDGMTWSDVDRLPRFSALLDKRTERANGTSRSGGVAVGNLVVRSVHAVTCPVDGWLALSASTRASARSDGDAPCSPVPAAGGGSHSAVPGWSAYVSAAAEQSFDAHLGGLGDAITQAGLTASAIGRAAAVALATTAGTVAGDVVVPASSEPADLSGAVQQTAADQLTIVDLGTDETLDADEALGAGEALDARLVAVLGAVLGEDPTLARTTVIVASLADRPGATITTLQAALVLGHGSGFLTSSSTRTPGLVLTTDIPATITARLGITGQSSAGQSGAGQGIGAPIRTAGAGDDVSVLSAVAPPSYADAWDLAGARDRLVDDADRSAAAHDLYAGARALMGLLGGMRRPGRDVPGDGPPQAPCGACRHALARLAPGRGHPRERGPVVAGRRARAGVRARRGRCRGRGGRRRSRRRPPGRTPPAGRATPAGRGCRDHHPRPAPRTRGPPDGRRRHLARARGRRRARCALAAGQPAGDTAAARGALLRDEQHLVRLLRRLDARDRGRSGLGARSAPALGRLVPTHRRGARLVDAAPHGGGAGRRRARLAPGRRTPGPRRGPGWPDRARARARDGAVRESGITVRARHWVATVLVAVGVVVAAAVADWSRGPQQRTHLGGFVQSVLDGDAGDVLGRKLSGAFGVMTSGWLAVLVSLGAVALLWAIARAWRRQVPGLDAHRNALWVWAVPVTLVVAALVNDSGPGILALGIMLAAPLLLAWNAARPGVVAG